MNKPVDSDAITYDEAYEIVRAGMHALDVRHEEIDAAISELNPIEKSRMLTGAITVIAGLRALGWRVARPLKVLQGGKPNG